MRKKHTTENAGGASAAVLKLERPAEADTFNLSTDKIDTAVSTLRVVWLALQSKEWLDDESVDSCAECLDQATRDLRAFRVEFAHKALNLPERSQADQLEDMIAGWQRAYAAWTTDEKDGGIPNGTPESKAEEAALAALVRAPCLSPKDVQRKASLFFENDYLRNIASDYTSELLFSFSNLQRDL
ncbi:hypothetical protein [uncultured Agrobacterium sp.]|uniref:hypothetical protein n=1 Tax=uncultured Agrobacterium sp. TaxID=157277 RepID=UPI0025FD8D88|nr:hypothetical protein [uncultured Agrobacterium sp.]